MGNNHEHGLMQDFQDAFSSYQTLSDMLKTYSYDEIIGCVAAFIGTKPEKLEQYPMVGDSKGMTSRAYSFVLQDLLRNIEQYDWVYNRLEDDISRSVFTNLIRYRVLPVQSFLKAAYDAKNPQYFDKNIVSCNQDEVFVDCGGFIGDTTETFIQQFGSYKHIYVYEPVQDNIQICRDNLKKYNNLTVRQCGVGEKSDVLSVEGGGSSSSFMKSQQALDSEGIQIISLDEDIQEPITFLKMDIEGFEIPALLGAKRHIRDDFPKLAICTYHIVSDMWEIPRLIDAIRPGYRFFIRHYDFPQNWETVIYAMPPEKSIAKKTVKSVKRRKRVVSIAFDEGWTNAQLIKDCGLIPYLFYKNHHCDAYMVGSKRENEYSNAQYVDGLRMEFLSDGESQTKADWLEREAATIDCLLLYGCYPFYYSSLVEIYKKRNPKGKIFLALDASSHWMDRMQWTDPVFCQFMDRCDVIGAAGRIMQKHLNEKWPWVIEYVPNGFYNFSSETWKVDFEKKENIILTVGRLGTTQKATHILLESFGQIAEKIPDWELHLVGDVEPVFEDYLTQFRKRFPALQHRIQFLGSISDRDALYREYKKAKIFALTSLFEGGTPNVIAEALYAGNTIAVTKIDEYQDAIDDGRCGLVSETDNVSEFADILMQLCQKEDLEKMCRHAYKYAQENFNMEKIVAKLYYLIFGDEG